MNKNIFILASMLASALSLQAQSAMDAFTYSQSQLRGTARYVSMGGAFGALGGDLSTLNQNPAGLGVYRSSEIGASFDVDFQRTNFQTVSANSTEKGTKFSCDNFGYAGSASTGSSLMPFFNWGVTYNRVNSFNRSYSGRFNSIGNSWSNYVASFSGNYSPAYMLGTDDYDPFVDSSIPWISLLAYNTLLINPDGNGMAGLFKSDTYGSAEVQVNETGYVDEYSINFGGNFINQIYWGIGFGITDFTYRQNTYYCENLGNALVPNANDNGLTNGSAEWGIENLQQVSGTGFNVKLGLIFKPINEFRLGLAVHTPTWYKFNYNTNAWVDYGLGDIEPDGYYTYDSMVDDNPYATTGNGYWNNKFKSPWRLMASAAGVLGGRFILSADYVYEAYPSMEFSDNLGVIDDIAGDVKQYYSPSSELRIGAEFRCTPAFSIRAGYNFKSAAAKTEAKDALNYFYTTGTQSMVEMKGDRNNVTFGLGYRTGGFYLDLAYVYSTQKSNWYAYSSFPAIGETYDLQIPYNTAPSSTLTTSNSRLVFSLGYKF